MVTIENIVILVGTYSKESIFLLSELFQATATVWRHYRTHSQSNFTFSVIIRHRIMAKYAL